MTAEIAVLSYHGWEIDPELVTEDVRNLRSGGWRDVSLFELEELLSGRRRRAGKFFHVTSDDGSEGDYKFVAALRTVSCPSTLFISLGMMSEKDKDVHRRLLGSPDVQIEDHSLRHNRSFHFRHVVGFHSDGRPLVSSPERMGLALGSPVCIYGPELLRPAFKPSTAAVSVCKEAALSTEEPEGSDIWGTCIARRLIDSGAGFRRLGKLCVRGEYESRQEYERRISCYLEEGQELLYEFTSSTPVAFAFPWWQQSPFAEKTLKELGYRMTFSGNDLCRRQSASGIPRLFINNETPRPLNLSLLVEHQRKNTLGRLRALAMRALYA